MNCTGKHKILQVINQPYRDGCLLCSAWETNSHMIRAHKTEVVYHCLGTSVLRPHCFHFLSGQNITESLHFCVICILETYLTLWISTDGKVLTRLQLDVKFVRHFTTILKLAWFFLPFAGQNYFPQSSGKQKECITCESKLVPCLPSLRPIFQSCKFYFISTQDRIISKFCKLPGN